MKVICSPDPKITNGASEIAFGLFQTKSGVGRLGAQIPVKIRRFGIVPTLKAWDFLAFSLAVIAADQACLRKHSPDGWTRQIELHVSVVSVETWKPHENSLAKALSFLTGDIWTITFHSGGKKPLPQLRRPRVELTGDMVCLLSGGVDSLVGAIDLVCQNKSPVFVSQVAKGDSEKQKYFAKSIGKQLSHIQLTHAAQPPGVAENSQRARSIIFLAYGLLVATSLPSYQQGSAISLIVPENGYISLNVPLTSLRIGSLSTRTTHPFFLNQVQNIWNSLGFRVNICNPYQFCTKGEMLAKCKNQKILRSLVFRATSCGRFGRFRYKHCGRCIPCLVRRAAFLCWDVEDQTSYHYNKLKPQNSFDDVRSLAMAILTIKRDGVERWAGNAINYVQLGDINPYIDVVTRGVAELERFLKKEKVL